MDRTKKIKIWRIIAFIGLLLSFLLGGAFRMLAQNAADILDKAAGVYERSGGITAGFALHVRGEGGQTGESYEGTIDMRGDKFVLRTPDMIVWFDGHTQWTYLVRNEEVNVGTPTGEELQWTNPAMLLRLYKKGFKPVLKGESTARNGKAAYDIELVPEKKGDVQRVGLQIEKLSGWPASVTVEGKNGVSHTIAIDRLTAGVNQPDTFFVFKESDFPDAEVIDLR